MARLMQEIHQAGLGTDSSHLYLGFAFAKLGRFSDAISEFGQVEQPSDWREEVIYCNSYAYALTCAGCLEEARAHVQECRRPSWPREQREWADQFLAGREIGEPIPPRRPRLLH